MLEVPEATSISFALIAIESKNAGIRRKSFFIIWNFKMLVFKVVIHVFMVG